MTLYWFADILLVPVKPHLNRYLKTEANLWTRREKRRINKRRECYTERERERERDRAENYWEIMKTFVKVSVYELKERILLNSIFLNAHYILLSFFLSFFLAANYSSSWVSLLCVYLFASFFLICCSLFIYELSFFLSFFLSLHSIDAFCFEVSSGTLQIFKTVNIQQSAQNYTTPDDDKKYDWKRLRRRYGIIPLPSRSRH